jgi:ABC-type antimicrobial peptide transport system permease subunit
MASSSIREIPEQVKIPWGIAFTVSWAGLKRRFLRSIITMIGVVLAIAFLSYMLVYDDIIKALVAADVDDLNELLQKKGVNIFETQGTNTLMLLLLGLSLLTCLVGIINSMLMSVTERVKEIGTLKCLGALDSFIVRTYFIESSLQGVIGTVIGLVSGFVIALVVMTGSYHSYVFSHMHPGAVFLSLLKSLVIGSMISIVAAIGPAYMAARKQPVEALRVEE